MKNKKPFEWNKVTPLSKYLAMALFIVLPYIGFVLGMKYQQKIGIIDYFPVKSSSPTSIQTVNWNTFNIQKSGVSFKYDNQLSYLENSNGTTSFFENDKDKENCLSEPKSIESSCFKAKYIFSGLSEYKQDEYQNYLKEEAKIGNPLNPKTFVDAQGRKWQTDIVLGEVYNYTASYNQAKTYYVLSFQAGYKSKSEEEVRQYFDATLSTVEFR